MIGARKQIKWNGWPALLNCGDVLSDDLAVPICGPCVEVAIVATRGEFLEEVSILEPIPHWWLRSPEI